MKCTFLEKFFLASRTVSIGKEICGIRQHTGETLHDYWERFNKLYATCPYHQISEYTESSRIRIDHLIANNKEDNHFSQDRIKGHTQLNNSDPHRIPI
ncbi:hypothetical protein CR513_61115, partial [Mucuna pruriens]